MSRIHLRSANRVLEDEGSEAFVPLLRLATQLQERNLCPFRLV